ncbi:helix-turn-helix domain-containing protein [Streptomyces halobius]|uniref:Helix-turn-helix domain-containing protein n=1 Tax=Streptomyces halobius TaxID=2879846 RepID=A0ABY4MIQ6_9ACTN|nr:helix-turn-helix transcriptional regulator [Streptomyces halobius]UQA97685.1 helix-turn-helix domain-containing protein [Streptomyces halobius]
MLREWRDRRRISQLELELRADSSARHISFIETATLYDEVSGYPLPEGGRESAVAGDHLPFALPMRIEHRGTVLSFISSIATFNTPMDVTVSEPAMETFLPADPETADRLRTLTP